MSRQQSSRSSRERWLATWGAAGFVFAFAAAASAEPRQVEIEGRDGRAWTIEIVPAELQPVAYQDAGESDQASGASSGSGQPSANGARPVVAGPQVTRTEEHGVEIVAAHSADSGYAAAYASIPFMRSVFDFNPTYRHDAAMEILTGNPRPANVYAGRGARDYRDRDCGYRYRPFIYPLFGYKPTYYGFGGYPWGWPGSHYQRYYPLRSVFWR